MSNCSSGLFLPLKLSDNEIPKGGNLLTEHCNSATANEAGNSSIGMRNTKTAIECNGSQHFTSESDVDDDLPGVTDVIIIGAGPSGLVLAYLLARLGIKFVVLDHNRVPLPREEEEEKITFLPTQGILLNAHTLDLLHVMGLMHDVISVGRPIQGGSIISEGRVVRQVHRFHKSHHTRFQTGVCLEQWKFERLLCDKLRLLDVKIYRQHVAYRIVIKIGDQSSVTESVSAQNQPFDAKESSVSVSAHGDYRVRVFVRKMDPIARRPHPGSVGKWLLAKYVVGADGVKSMTRKALEIDMIPLSPPRRYLIADFEVEDIGIDTMAASHYRGLVNDSPKGPTDNHLFVVHTKQNAGIFIPYFANNHWRLIISKSVNASEGENESPAPVSFVRLDTPTADEVTNIIHFLIPKAVVKSILWRTAYSTASMIASQMVKERGILIGDAAQQHPPLWSAGVNAAVYDAFALGWRLAAVLEHRSIPAILETFDEEQRAFAKSTMEYALNCRDKLVDCDFIKWNCESSLIQFLKGSQRIIGAALTNTVIPHDDVFLLRSDADRGVSLGSIRVLGFPASEDGAPRIASMDAFYQDSSHVLFLLLRVLPYGFKSKTLLGCEKKESTARYSKKDVDDLVQLARTCEQVFYSSSTKSPDDATTMVTPGHSDRSRQEPARLKIVWVICGLIDAKSVKMKELTVSHSQLVKQLPVNLRTFIVHGCTFKSKVYTVIDHECQMQSKSRLDLAPSDSWADEILVKTLCQESTEDHAAAFILMRPDGKVSAMGYSKDSRSRGALEEYSRHFFDGLS